MNGCTVYCVAVRRWASRRRGRNTAKGSDLTSNKKGVGRSLTRKIWRAGGTPKTHLVPLFCGAGAAAVATKHFLSASVTAGLLLIVSHYLSTGIFEGKITGKKPRFNGLIERRS